MSPQFDCIYNGDTTTYKRDSYFTSLWQHQEKLQYQLQNKTVIDFLPTQQDLQPCHLPGVPDPLPRFMEPCNSQPDTSPTEDPPEKLVADLTAESLKHPPNAQTDRQEIHANTTTIVS